MLSFDEWNVWYRTRRGKSRTRRELAGRPLTFCEEIYNMKDALAFGGACISLLNHADRVKVACLAQLVNAIAPIMTETGGPAWRQTIFFPFADFSNLGRGRVLKCAVDSPAYAASYFDPRGTTELHFPIPAAPYVKAAAVHGDDDTLTFFLLNRNLEEDAALDIATEGIPRPQDRARDNSWARRPRGNEHEGEPRRRASPEAPGGLREQRELARQASASVLERDPAPERITGAPPLNMTGPATDFAAGWGLGAT